MKTKFALIALVALWLQAERTAYRNFRCSNHNQAVVAYLAQKLDENGIKQTEFDQIVLNDFTNNKP